MSEPYIRTHIGGKRVWVQADQKRDAQKRQRRTGNLAEKVPQTSVSFQTQGIHTPLHQILVLIFVTTPLQKSLYMEL